jgi:hypothetical protein
MLLITNGHYSNLRAGLFRPEFPSCTALEKRQSLDGCAGFKATSPKDGQRHACRAKRSVIDRPVFLLGRHSWSNSQGGEGSAILRSRANPGGLVAAKLDGY